MTRIRQRIVSCIKIPLKKPVPLAVSSVILLVLLLATKPIDPPESIIWKLDNTGLIGNHKPVILGNPRVVNDNGGPCLSFNGVNDGLVMPEIPIKGWKQFTIEVLFKPAGDGPREPRFIHFQDSALNRGTFEIRLTSNGHWYMDTFLKNGRTNKGLTLIDSALLHKADRWYWAALIYDRKKMTSYVNRRKELEGEIDLPPMTSGEIAMGVRLNKVSWFKGLIKEVQFHPVVLEANAMQSLD